MLQNEHILQTQVESQRHCHTMCVQRFATGIMACGSRLQLYSLKVITETMSGKSPHNKPKKKGDIHVVGIRETINSIYIRSIFHFIDYLLYPYMGTLNPNKKPSRTIDSTLKSPPPKRGKRKPHPRS